MPQVNPQVFLLSMYIPSRYKLQDKPASPALALEAEVFAESLLLFLRYRPVIGGDLARTMLQNTRNEISYALSGRINRYSMRRR